MGPHILTSKVQSPFNREGSDAFVERTSVCFERDNGGRYACVMRDRDENAPHAQAIRVLASGAQESDLRRAALVRADFDLVPPHVWLATESLRGGLFGGKTPGERRRAVSACSEVQLFARRQDALPEFVAEALERRLNAFDRGDVDA